MLIVITTVTAEASVHIMIKNGKMTTKSTIFHNPAPAHEITSTSQHLITTVTRDNRVISEDILNKSPEVLHFAIW